MIGGDRMPYIRGVISRADIGEADGTPIRFVASTQGVARDGLIIDANAWNLDNFRRNPVVLWAHDYSGARPPIGRADVFVDGDRLLADVMFDQSDEFARSIETKYRSGFLHSVSVGWDTQSIEPTTEPNARGRVTRADLLDISAVPVPGDPNALIARQARALAAIADATDPNKANHDGDANGWSDTAAAMASLYRDTVEGRSDGFADRYRTLARAYERAGRTAPEFLEPSAIVAIGIEGVRPLFVEGEPEMFPDSFDIRAGAVLSRENVADLTDAMALIARVVDRSKKAGAADPNGEEPMRAIADASGVDDDVFARIRSVLTGKE